MTFDQESLDYLSGKKFSNGYRFPIDLSSSAEQRMARIVQLVRGKSVLHVGCCDHLDLIRTKVDQGLYLHQLLCQSAARCVGSDINQEGIALMRELGFPEVYTPDAVPSERYDVCLLADVIEHVGDVVGFLKSLRQYEFSELIVVTPNMFRARNFFSRGEIINTDHRYWFSPFTLSKVLTDAGFTPRRLELCHSDSNSWRARLLAGVLNHAPKYRDMLIVTATR
jgi:hypothetical protein